MTKPKLHPLRGPLHPALVHLPLAALPVAVFADVLTRFWPAAPVNLNHVAFVGLAAGVATGVFAAGFGIVDYVDLRPDHPAKRIATRHFGLNIVALALFALSLGLHLRTSDTTRAPPAAVGVDLLGLVLLGYSGYLGGVLVYDDGIGVGRHRRTGPAPRPTIRVPAGPGMVAVAPWAALAEGTALRVDRGGIIVTIVRCGDTCHAFQEYCTHRYGPLSEGAIADCTVECPWHRSRFDVRTGAVLAGPAKVPLRTFRTDVRDGQIWLDAA